MDWLKLLLMLVSWQPTLQPNTKLMYQMSIKLKRYLDHLEDANDAIYQAIVDAEELALDAWWQEYLNEMADDYMR